eukprot:TRINITY_DN11784_c0_g1_i1.p2 TRINITY_DN11784_c0_g1~~TRINITY_DN11784_c0_g1_i1.p2  ORF type:complete len:192 (+),score=32.93 TRINITY_DN11784_c0_g1_i1:28-603(+)
MMTKSPRLTLASLAVLLCVAFGDDPYNCTEPLLGVSLGTVAVECGTTYALEDTQQQPRITAPSSGLPPNSAWTLVMVDPDAPSADNPTASPIRHWVVGNLMAADLEKGDVSKGTVVSSFRPPGPPAGSGYHRYWQFLYRQPVPDMNYEPLPDDTRRNWDFEQWARNIFLSVPAQFSNYYRTERPQPNSVQK